ncbi:hypothetical protein [Nonomuraea dietziae]
MLAVGRRHPALRRAPLDRAAESCDLADLLLLVGAGIGYLY